VALDLAKYTALQRLGGPLWTTYQALTQAADASGSASWAAADKAQFELDLAASWANGTFGNVTFRSATVYPGVDADWAAWGDSPRSF
jgi:hypothetical protein